ncbi:RAS-like protein [Sporothrix schenckii 1099-18]|uniref:RAS-like protein n=1 Tax=Sporothrix schenckii 1099-18 TaxID=1397361 RepID=A0A0F2MCT6_SPOSC|nr:RAS-like protein [Sporothrix schenckii 1099-18]KJR87447.1 RAS-like protein [Sporothrix schenckii 1099-18]
MPHSQTGSRDQPPVPISITICGDGGCGKSSITLRLVRSQWTSEYDPTIEDSYSVTRRIDGVTYHLGLTDTAGQEEYRGMWASSNLGADAFLMVYDITSRDSLDALQYFNDLIDMEAETRLDNAARARKAGVPLRDITSGGSSGARAVAPVKIVAGNKCDLQESRVVPAAKGLDWARRRGCGFMETSARLEVNIEETFALIVRRVVEARRLAALGGAEHDPSQRMDRRGMTKPLSPLPAGSSSTGHDAYSGGDARQHSGEKDAHGNTLPGRQVGVRGPRIDGDQVGRGANPGFWKTLRCW